jgi:prepilin-type N-terminal cleavage/methylation domain-containing protein/prepilin-type processing-associated H-X9-DG protein
MMRHPTLKGFTLVELLVVIGIIGLLIAVLLPALRGAREQAKSVQCMSNLRACGQLLYIYANQNRGMFPMMKVNESQQFPRNKSGVTSNVNGVKFQYPDVKAALAMIANKGQDPYKTPFSPGGLKVFYCPANWFWDEELQKGRSHKPEDFMRDAADPGTPKITGCLNYWYFGNPDPWYPKYHYGGTFSATGSPPATATGSLDWRFWDANRNGDNRDDYVIRLGEKRMTEKVLMTDQSRQAGPNLGGVVGFQLIHGNRYNFLKGWVNVLHADGHVASVKANAHSFSEDHTTFINPNPSPDEFQPHWGNANQYEMW